MQTVKGFAGVYLRTNVFNGYREVGSSTNLYREAGI